MRRKQAVLLYDSARPEAAFVSRSAIRIDRTLVFRAEAHTVDMVIHEGDGEVGLLLGQVIHERDGNPVSDAPVRFLGETDGSVTDGHGQFSLSCDRLDEPGDLSVELPDTVLLLAIPGVEGG